MLGYLAWLTLREQDCSDEPGPVPQVIVLVKLGQVEDILGDELSLWRVGEIHLHSQVDNLKLDWHLLGTECLGLVIFLTTSWGISQYSSTTQTRAALAPGSSSVSNSLAIWRMMSLCLVSCVWSSTPGLWPSPHWHSCLGTLQQYRRWSGSILYRGFAASSAISSSS